LFPSRVCGFPAYPVSRDLRICRLRSWTPQGKPLRNPWLYTGRILPRGLTEANFGGDRLSPGPIGFSPLPRGHGRGFPHPFGPPRRITSASPCPGVDRPASGRARVTNRSFERIPSGKTPAGFRFPYGFGVLPLNLATRAHSPAHSSKRTVGRDNPVVVLTRRRGFPTTGPNPPYHTIPVRFQDLFTPCHGFFSPFGRPTSPLSASGSI
jgi:hypothetical protein